MPLLIPLLLTLLGLPIAVAILALVRTARLQRRVEALEAALLRRTTQGASVTPEGARDPAPAAPATPASPSAAEPATPRQGGWREPDRAEPATASRQASRLGALITDRAARLKATAWGWLTEGNVPVKVGTLVLFAGLAALIRHATEEGWLSLPPALRLAGIALLALGALGFGWRQRQARRVFALSLQGGAVGILLMVIFAAAQRFGLVPLPLAFALSVTLVAGLCLLAVLQNALALAVLGTLAGFLAPLWLASGRGDPAVLFGYYALLNLAIFAIAWYRPWRLLNLLGFLATFVIATAWGVLAYRPQDYAIAQPFLALFFLIYLVIPILYARRRPPSRSGLTDGRMIDGSLVFGTPLVAFGLQAALLEGARLPLAFCALGLGLLYTLLAALLRRRPSLRPLGEGHAVLAVGLATLAVPLALSARVSASVFAVEGAALIWLGLRQHRLLPQLTGAGLQLLAGVVLILSLPFQRPETLALANPTFMAGALIAASGLASAWCLRHRGLSRWALGAYLWGLAWWLGTALQEIGRFAPSHLADDWRLALLALTGALIAEFHRRHPAPALAWSLAAGLLATLPLLAAPLVAPHSSPVTLSQLAPWGWALVVILGDRQLRVLRLTAVGAPHHREPGAWAQGAWLWALALFLTGALLAALPPPLGEGWRLAAALLPWLGLLALLLLRPPLLLAAMLPRAEAWRPALAASLALALAALWLLLLGRPGSPAPLAWWPLLNPLFLAQGASLLVLWRLQRDPICPARLQERGVLALALAAFALLSLEVLRGAHLLGLGPWSPSLLEHQAVQTALTLLWSVLGVSGWILGSRRRLREVWLVSALLMAVVLAKLVLVDRTHLGNLLGIASFIGYGLLCIAVGYIAPAPPRQAREPASQEETP
ncbi:DUF2339 domain-containing protein [Halomonas mongoliensis]|uniref:DUF2339 domain-containing protein n=1 Tax=Halomonas mongoliensis TaxID=321265 RepID=UPI00403B1CAB